MLPRRRQRLILAVAVVVGALVWLSVWPAITPADGASGLSLMNAPAGLFAAIGLILLAGLPAVLLSVFASTLGNPVSGFFAVSASLLVLACAGGSIKGWLRGPMADGRTGYLDLFTETIIWLIMLVAMMILTQRARSPIRVRFPALAFDDHLGIDTAFRFPTLASLGAGAVSAAVAGALSLLVLRSADIGQVIGGLMVAFLIGGMVGHLFFPQTNPVGILLSPGIVALAGYGYVGFVLRLPPDELLARWYAGKLPGLALALPIHYMSAGLLGATLGLGWAQTMISGNKDAAQAADGLVVAPAVIAADQAGDKADKPKATPPPKG